jgi:hypothetical protein
MFRESALNLVGFAMLLHLVNSNAERLRIRPASGRQRSGLALDA